MMQTGGEGSIDDNDGGVGDYNEDIVKKDRGNRLNSVPPRRPRPMLKL